LTVYKLDSIGLIGRKILRAFLYCSHFCYCPFSTSLLTIFSN